MQPTNIELALIRAVAQSRPNYQVALALGAGADVFAPDGPHGTRWQEIAALYERDIDPAPELLRGETSELFSGDARTPEQTAELVRRVTGVALRKQGGQIGSEWAGRAKRESLSETLPWLRGKIDRLELRYLRAAHPTIGNPADTLESLRTWSITTGVPIVDKWIRYTSGDPHFIASDPMGGKTTLCINFASGASSEGISTLVILAEPKPLEIQLGMLSQLQNPQLDANLMNDLRFDPTARENKANILKVRRAWDNTYAAAPLRIVQISDGPDEAVSLISSLSEPTFILIDHAFAVVKQVERHIREGEHIAFYRFFQQVQRESQRGNHIPVIFNQFTKAGRATTDRGPDAQYGGSGVRAIAGSMWHLRLPSSDLLKEKGHQQVIGQYVKVRARLVCDALGNRVNPLAVGKNGQTVAQTFYVNHRYRSICEDVYDEYKPPER